MKLLIIGLLVVTSCFAGKLNWLRWGVEAANCGMAMLDVVSTTEGIRLGAVETNPLLLTRGQISWGKLYVVKGIVCAVPVITTELVHKGFNGSPQIQKGMDWDAILGIGGSAAYQGFIVHQNYGVIKELKKEGQ